MSKLVDISINEPGVDDWVAFQLQATAGQTVEAGATGEASTYSLPSSEYAADKGLLIEISGNGSTVSVYLESSDEESNPVWYRYATPLVNGEVIGATSAKLFVPFSAYAPYMQLYYIATNANATVKAKIAMRPEA